MTSQQHAFQSEYSTAVIQIVNGFILHHLTQAFDTENQSRLCTKLEAKMAETIVRS